ncbi:hypothetical protein Fuma_00082 [Fuerstiella marisgermanici]|uniref:Uncharacterized protein n=2 Tax=Fuerstiella marisgermanici TaxID=1891926 RepID=A0A1P8W8W2_9PLAN|nr:hypothetical protein Fuma_00082 [Fuerstiella marisgermanici]
MIIQYQCQPTTLITTGPNLGGNPSRSALRKLKEIRGNSSVQSCDSDCLIVNLNGCWSLIQSAFRLMTQFHDNHTLWTRSLGGTRLYACVLVMGAVTFLGNSNAHASCGDYLFRNGVPVSGHSDARLNEVDHQAESQPPSRPCHSPNCSKGRSPVTPDSPTMSRSFDQDALLLQFVSAGQRPISSVAAESEAVADVRAVTIFRPPRASTSVC